MRRIVLAGMVLGATAGVASVTAGAAFAQAPKFGDVPAGHWASGSIDGLLSRGILVASGGQSKVPAAGKKTAYDGARNVTRYELAVVLYRFVQYVEASDKQKKGKTQAMAAPENGPAALKLLVAGGYISKTSPLLKDGNRPVSAKELSDAMTQVLVRSREKTTPRSPDSLPDIERPGGGNHDH